MGSWPMQDSSHPYEYEVVRINKATRKRQAIRFNSMILGKLDIHESEWKAAK